jgi:hypothetical protein
MVTEPRCDCCSETEPRLLAASPFRVADAGRKRLCYFHDPEGVLLEVAEYTDEH